MAGSEPEPSTGSFRSPQQPPAQAALDAADLASALSALCRFEFETSKGNEGTKILMVEWEPSSLRPDSPSAGDWEVSWEGKTTFLPARDREFGGQKRVYFLLPPGSPIPPLVTISRPKGPTISTKPLPAIFPPGLGVSHGDVGKRGVLHTIWAKKRLSELQDEIQSEMRANGESVGLEMAMQEVNWIRDQFGIGDSRPTSSTESSKSPASPRSPTGGRLGEKLKGLRLATSASELAAGPGALGGSHPNVQFAGWSPVEGDIAVSSFASFPDRSRANAPASSGAPISLDAALMSVSNNGDLNGTGNEKEDDLFALPMSPRSPEMTKSPFSLL